MKRIVTIILIFTASVYSQEIINLDVAKERVRNYYENGGFQKDLDSILAIAKEQINNLNLNENSTIIFDVDDTLLSGYEYTKSLGFGFTFPTWEKYINSASQKAVPQMNEFYNFVKAKNIKIVLLTGRDRRFYKSTIENLRRENFTGFDTLICRTGEQASLTASEYKEKTRELLWESGYEIIASVGDQESDFSGEHTGLKIKVPNYLYIIE